MKYCILVETGKTFTVGNQRSKIPPLFLLDAHENKPRLFDTEEEALAVMTELKKDTAFNGSRIEKFHE